MIEQRKSFLPDERETIIQLEIERLQVFKHHPFKVQDDTDMKLLTTMTIPEGVDVELLAKVLANPEMAALLTSLAKTMK